MNEKSYIRTCALFLLFVSPFAAVAAPGGLDTTFGTNGTVVTQAGASTNFVQGLALQSDGKIIAVGESNSGMSIVRYNANGFLDSTFNGTGMATQTPGSAYAVAVLPDGKIIVAGHDGNVANIDIKLLRYNANGTLDTTFDTDGIVTTAIGGGTDVAYAMAIQTDGKIVISARSDTPPNFQTSYAVVRYNADGSLDATFDGDGIVVPSISGNSFPGQMTLQADGKIVLAHNRIINGSQFLVVFRYNSNGSLDSSFGVDGTVTTAVGIGVEFATVAVQTNRKIVIACSGFRNATSYDFSVVRYNTDGSLDETFGDNGIVFTPIGPGGTLDQAKSVAIQANGKIVVGGRSPNGSNNDFVAVRYNKNGTLDAKWGTGGIVRSDLGGNADGIHAIAVQTNGRIVTAGESDFGSPGTRKFAIARYMGDTAENFDYDRDGAADISVYRPSEGNWYVLGSSAGSFYGVKWGIAADELAPADYDGDLKTDFAVWRAGPSAQLYVLNSFNNTVRIDQFGQTGDDPSVIADYDGDGKADPAVYRPGAAPGQQSYFYYRGSINNPTGNTTYVPWGTNGDVAVRGDYNGDGRFDPTVFRPANGLWFSLNLVNNANTTTQWGLSTDKLVPADYNGDGKTDLAVFRNGIWYILQSNTGLAQYAYWGLSTDKLVPSDYDGDGQADVAVYRDGTWYIQQSTGGNSTVSFGLPTDIPTPIAYMP